MPKNLIIMAMAKCLVDGTVALAAVGLGAAILSPFIIIGSVGGGTYGAYRSMKRKQLRHSSYYECFLPKIKNRAELEQLATGNNWNITNDNIHIPLSQIRYNGWIRAKFRHRDGQLCRYNVLKNECKCDTLFGRINKFFWFEKKN